MTAAPERERERAGRAAVWAVAAAGVCLLVWQYAAGASLWVDELALARNVLDRGWRELLTTPLVYAQVAPAGFLALEKLATAVLGDSDRALRVVPFLCAVAGVVLFTRVALDALRPRGALVAVAIVALSARLIWNGAQAKQYAGDVLVAAAVLWLVSWFLAQPSFRRCVWASIAGLGAAFLSQPGAFVLAGGAAAIVLQLRRDPEGTHRRRGLIVAMTWLAAGGLAGVLARTLVAADTMAYMREYWATGFPSLPPHSADDLLWPWRALRGVFGTALTIRGVEVYAALAIVGAVALARRQASGVVVIVAILLGMAAAAARLFPFLDRPVVFAIPLLALACGAAADLIADPVGRRARILAWAIPLALVAGPGYRIVRRPPVYRIQETKPVLEWIAGRRQEGDALYVFYGAWQAARRYGPPAGLGTTPTVWGRCHRGAPREYFRELDSLRGKPRVWIFVTHAEPRFRERDAILGYLDAIGERRLSTSIPEPYLPSVGSAEGHLYDLSDPARLGATDAERAMVPPGAERPAAQRECRGPIIPDEQWLRTAGVAPPPAD